MQVQMYHDNKEAFEFVLQHKPHASFHICDKKTHFEIHHTYSKAKLRSIHLHEPQTTQKNVYLGVWASLR